MSKPTGDPDWRKRSYNSVRGNIIIDWEKQGSHFSLYVIIPANTTVTILIPTNKDEVGMESGISFKVQYQDGYAVFLKPNQENIRLQQCCRDEIRS